MNNTLLCVLRKRGRLQLGVTIKNLVTCRSHLSYLGCREKSTVSPWGILQALIAVILMGTLAVNGQARAATYYVATTGSDSNPGTSAQPFRTITYAYSRVVAGDLVLVQPGTYTDYQSAWGLYLNKNGTSGSPITLQSVVRGGAIIDGTGESDRPYCVILYGTSYNVVDGFTIRNCLLGGITLYWDGANASTHNTFINNEISNISNPTPGPHGRGGQGIAENEPANNNVFCQNYIHDIGAAWDSNFDHGMYMEGSNSTYCNNIISHNTYGNGIQLSASNSVMHNTSVFQNTITNNLTNGIVVWSRTSSFAFYNLNISNNIIYGNRRGLAGCAPIGAVTANNNISFYNAVENYNTDYCGGGTAAWTNNKLIQSDPMFINPTSDFHLQSGSPAIGAGISLPSITQDFAGNPRPSPTGWDVGAYSSVSGSCGLSTGTRNSNTAIQAGKL